MCARAQRLPAPSQLSPSRHSLLGFIVDDLDTVSLSRELMRALRGRRSREAFARRLKVSANSVYAWESGRRIPPADLLFLAGERTGLDVLTALRRFLGARATLDGLSPADRRLPGQVLAALRGGEQLVALARRAQVERCALSRWLSGRAVPRLPDFLSVVEAAGSRAVDLVALFADPERLPSLSTVWTRVRRTRQLVSEHPWAMPLLMVFDLASVAEAATHPPGFLGGLLGLDLGTEQRCLELLESEGLIAREGERWVQLPRPAVVLQSPTARRAARVWSAQAAAGQIDAEGDGDFGFILFAASRADHARLVALQRAYLEAVRDVALRAQGGELLLVMNAHLFPLGPGACANGPLSPRMAAR